MLLQLIATLVYSLLYRLFVPQLESLTSIDRPCGLAPRPKERIIGGAEAPLFGWPWIASIETINGINFCGGALISPRHVLTAAHCIPVHDKIAPFLLRVSLGASTIGSGEIFYIQKVEIHPEYGMHSSYYSDIAILTLSEDIQSHHALKMVCLPEHGVTERNLVALGWGWTSVPKGNKVDKLRQVTLEQLPATECQVYGKLFDAATMMCVGFPDGGRDACKGDSGGPLLQISSSGTWAIHGLVSFGKGCGAKNFPGVYTNVIVFKDWINKVIYN